MADPARQARMEEGLCRLAAVAVTQRALTNVKRQCVPAQAEHPPGG